MTIVEEQLERQIELNAELCESLRRKDVKIALLEEALLKVRGVRNEELPTQDEGSPKG